MEAAFIGATYALIAMLGTALFALLRINRKHGIALEMLVSILEHSDTISHDEAQRVRDARR